MIYTERTGKPLLGQMGILNLTKVWEASESIVQVGGFVPVTVPPV